jgi:hypothetical protein
VIPFEKTKMPHLDFGIYRTFPDGASMWMENANTLQSAKIRAVELAHESSTPITVYDLRNPAKAVFEAAR